MRFVVDMLVEGGDQVADLAGEKVGRLRQQISHELVDYLPVLREVLSVLVRGYWVHAVVDCYDCVEFDV